MTARHSRAGMTAEARRQPDGTSSSACQSACWSWRLTTTTNASAAISPDWLTLTTDHFLCHVVESAPEGALPDFLPLTFILAAAPVDGTRAPFVRATMARQITSNQDYQD
jgi:hypothetical protein